MALHPNYDQHSLEYDISILTLVTPLLFSPSAAPICLPASTSRLYTGQTATATGWDSSLPAPTVHEAEVTVVSNAVCKNVWGSKKQIHKYISVLYVITFYYIMLYLVRTFALLTLEEDHAWNQQIEAVRCL